MTGIHRLDTSLGPIQAAFDAQGAVRYQGFADHEFREALVAKLARLGPVAPAGPNLSRAVGRANGANPVSILVPCHRVIGAQGRLTGYAGGLGMKERLLRLEGALRA